MKYFSTGRTGNGYGNYGITLDDKVFSISKSGNNIVFREECDGYFFVQYSKSEAIELLQEAIDWIESDGQDKKKGPEKIKIWVCDNCGEALQSEKSKWKIGETPAIEVIFNNVDDIPDGRMYEVMCKKCIDKQNGSL